MMVYRRAGLEAKCLTNIHLARRIALIMSQSTLPRATCQFHAYPVASQTCNLRPSKIGRANLPSPTSLPDFMLFFPDEAECAA